VHESLNDFGAGSGILNLLYAIDYSIILLQKQDRDKMTKQSRY